MSIGKQLGRVGGVSMAFLSGYLEYYNLARLDYSKVSEFFLGDYPIEHKIFAGLYIVIPTVLLGGLLVDGLTDIVKGTHHYFSLRIWQKLTTSEKRKEDIEEAINVMLNL